MKKVLIVGAGFLQRFVIQKAKAMGYYTLAVDGNPNAEGFADADECGAVNIIDQEAVCAFAREKGVDGILTAATDYGVLATAYTAQELGLPGLNYASAQRIKNKYETRKCLFEAGADDSAPSRFATEETDLKALAESLEYPVMVKPCDGSGSRGAARIEKSEDFPAACREAIESSLSRKATIEPFIIGREYGVESLVVKGNIHILGVMQKEMTKPPYYAELGHGLPSGLPEHIEQKVRTCVEKAIRALGVNHGSVNMDLLLTEKGTVHIIDIGARMGGNLIGSHIIPLGTGIDYMGNMIRAAVGDPVDMTPVSAPTPVATRLLAFDRGIVKALPDFPALEKRMGVEVRHHLALGQTVNEYHTNLDGCGYVVATANHIDQAAAIAEAAKNEIGNTLF